MDELDARLRAMAKREDWALPAAYESAMDGLEEQIRQGGTLDRPCLLYTSPSPRDRQKSRMPSSA